MMPHLIVDTKCGIQWRILFPSAEMVYNVILQKLIWIACWVYQNTLPSTRNYSSSGDYLPFDSKNYSVTFRSKCRYLPGSNVFMSGYIYWYMIDMFTKLMHIIVLSVTDILASTLTRPLVLTKVFICFLQVSMVINNFKISLPEHYNDIMMSMMASQITSLKVIYSTVYSGVDQRKHHSSASLAFVRGIHQGQVNSPDKWPEMWQMFPLYNVIMKDDHIGHSCWELNLCYPGVFKGWGCYTTLDNFSKLISIVTVNKHSAATVMVCVRN